MLSFPALPPGLSALSLAAALLVAAGSCAGDPAADAGTPKPAAAAPPAAPAPETPDPAAPDPAAPDPAAVADLAVHEILGEGIDASGHAGQIDWQELHAAGHTFAFIKATEGVDLVDPSFDLWWPAIKEAGIVRGAYHFYVTEDDPEEQAEFFISRAELAPGDLAPVVDVELIGHGTKAGLADRLRTFLSILEEHYGVKPIIYTSAKFWNRHLDDSFGAHPLWVAEYEVDEPALPIGWEEWHLWQHSGDAPVPGVEKGVDLSRVNKSGVDLSKLVIPGPP